MTPPIAPRRPIFPLLGSPEAVDSGEPSSSFMLPIGDQGEARRRIFESHLGSSARPPNPLAQAVFAGASKTGENPDEPTDLGSPYIAAVKGMARTLGQGVVGAAEGAATLPADLAVGMPRAAARTGKFVKDVLVEAKTPKEALLNEREFLAAPEEKALAPIHKAADWLGNQVVGAPQTQEEHLAREQIGPLVGQFIAPAVIHGVRAVPDHILQGEAQLAAAKGGFAAAEEAAAEVRQAEAMDIAGGPNRSVQESNDAYNADNGLPLIDSHTPVPHDVALSKKVADWYDNTPSNPEDPEVQASYKAFNQETEAQYQHLVDQGYRFTPTEDAVHDAYPDARTMRAAVAQKDLKVFTGGTPNPLMTPEQNFKFRAVHDVNAHAAEGYDFDPNGEYNAALKHAQMYTPLAQRALFTETVGQNSALNYGPNGEFNQANMGKEVFPEQKALAFPQEFADRLNQQRVAATPPPVEPDARVGNLTAANKLLQDHDRAVSKARLYGTPEDLAKAEALRNQETPGLLAAKKRFSQPSLQSLDRPDIRTRLDQFDKEITARINARRAGRLMSGFDPADIKDEALRLSVKLARGAVDFASWSKDMIGEVGESVRPHLQKIWDQGQKNWGRFQETLKNNDHELPDDARLDELFEKGKFGNQFYEDNPAGIEKIFGKKLAPTMMRAIAATSPAAEVTSNATLALKALKFHMTGQDLETGFMSTHRKLLEEVFAGKEFKSQKVQAFHENLANITNEDRVTVDRWMMRAFFGDKAEKPSANQFKFVEKFTRELAKEKGVSPREMQASIWYGIKKEADYGERTNYEHGKEAKTYPGELRKKIAQGYMDDLLEAQPDNKDLKTLRATRDEEFAKRNEPFKDRLQFQDEKKSALVTKKYAILTWANPHGKKYGRVYNEVQNRLLARELRRLGYDPIAQEGTYGGTREPSFLVPGLSTKDATDLARAGGQDAFITHQGYVSLKDGTVAPRQGVKFGNPTADYSEVVLNKGTAPIKYQIDYNFAQAKPIHPPLDLAPSERLAAWEAMNPKAHLSKGAKRALAIGAPVPFYAAAEMEKDPEKKAKLLGIAHLMTIIAVGSMVPHEQTEKFLAAMRSKLGDVLSGEEVPKNLGDYASREYWESRLGKLDNLTWARMKQTADRSFGEKLDPLGKAFVGEGKKQYLNQAYLMQDPEGKEFIDRRVKHWEEQGLRPIKMTDESTRKIADMLDVAAEDLSKSGVKSMTAPEILAVHDLMESSKEAVQMISRYIDRTPGLVKEQLDQLEDVMQRHLNRYDAASLKIFEVRSEAGRSLRQFKYLGEMIDTPGFWVHQAAKKLGVKMSEVPAQVAEDIQHFMKNGEFPPDSKLAAKAAGKEAKVARVRARNIHAEAQAMERVLLAKDQPKARSRAPRIGSYDNDITAYIKNAAADARARIKARQGTLYSGLDPQVLADYGILGVEYLHDGVVKLADFVERLKKEAPEVSDQDAKEVYVSAGRQYRDLRKGKGAVKGGTPGATPEEIVSPRGSQEPKKSPGALQEPHRVNLDKVPRSQRVENLGIEKAQELDLQGQAPEPEAVIPEVSRAYEGHVQTGKAGLPKTTVASAGPKAGPGLPGKAGTAGSFENVLKTLSPEQQQKLITYVNKLQPNDRIKGWISAWKAMLLTNPLTHKVNITGNTAHQALLVARNQAATGLDMVFSAARASFDREGKPWTQAYWDNRTRVFGLQQYKAALEGGVEGAKKGWYYLTTGFDQDDILSGLRDYKAETGVKPLDAVVNFVFKTLGAEDKVFKYSSYQQSIAEQAMLQASKERLSGSAWRNRVHEISKNPVVLGEEQAKTMLLRASEDAAFAVFQDQTQAAKALNAVVRYLPFLDPVIPFRKTVASIATKGLVDYNPVGALLQIGNLAMKGTLDQRKLTELVAGGSLGGAAMWMGYRMAEQDKATSSYPTDPTERELWAEENRKENSFLYDGRWYDYGKIPGIGPMISMGVAVHEFTKKGTSLWEGIPVAVLKGAKTTLDQNFLQGTNQALKALDDPEGMLPGLEKNYARSLVPAIVGAVARGTDQKTREVETPLDAIKAAIPGLSQTLPEKRTALDFPVEREGGVVGQMTGIGSSPTARKDVLVQELRRLDFAPGKPGKGGFYGETERKRTKDEYSLFVKAAGSKARALLYDLLDSADYKDAEDDDDRKKLITETVQEAREDTKDEETDQSYRDESVMEGRAPGPSLAKSNEKLTYQPIRDLYRARYAETR